MNLKYAILALLLLATVADAEEAFLKFPGVFYGDTRERTKEESKLFTFVEQKAAAPSLYYQLGKDKYLVTVDSALIISGVYYVAIDKGTLERIAGGNVEIVEKHKTKDRSLWFLVRSVGLRHGHGWDSYSAIVLISNEPQTPIVSSLIAVEYNDNLEGEIVNYTVQDRNGDGVDDIVFHTRERDLVKSTVKESETTYLFSKYGFYKKP